MRCPYCDSDSNVVDSRAANRSVRRRRVCSSCKRRFTTYERVAPPNIKVTKRGGRNEPFDPDKIAAVLARVCRERANVSEDDIRRITAAIEAELIDERAKAIASAELALRLLTRLGELDKLAYDRLAANYLDETGQLRTEPREASDNAGQLGLFGVANQDRKA